MKVKKSIRKTKKPSEADCMCSVHLRLTPDKPCLGHGEKCPCTLLISQQLINMPIDKLPLPPAEPTS